MIASEAIAYTTTDTPHNIIIGEGTLKLAVIKQMPHILAFIHLLSHPFPFDNNYTWKRVK